jgi:hypothetical protein
VALLAGDPAPAMIGFAGMGHGLANIAPIVASAAGRLPELAPGIVIAAVSTAGERGFLAGPPLIGLVALAVGFMILGAGALERQEVRAAALAG